MLHQLQLPNHPGLLPTFEEMSAKLDYDVRQLDSPESLRSTVSVQLALLAAAAGTARALEDERVTPKAVTGLSVGAFVAVHAHVLALADGIRLRGGIRNARAVPAGPWEICSRRSPAGK